MERVPCENQDICPWADRREGCHTSVHHLYYPRHDYRKEIAREFRNLNENKVRMCRFVHDLEHEIAPPPEMPPIEVMREAVHEEREKRINGLK